MNPEPITEVSYIVSYTIFPNIPAYAAQWWGSDSLRNIKIHMAHLVFLCPPERK